MIDLYDKGQVVGDTVHPQKTSLEQYLLEGNPEAPYVLVFPGGGYDHLAAHEGKDIAEWFNKRGLNAGVLYYQVNPVEIDKLLVEINDTLLWLKERYPKVGVIGFSAGGHLAALTSNKLDVSPDFSILAYPVISFESDILHLGSRTNLLGENPTEEQIKQYSANQLVSEKTPLTFIWSTVDDAAVPAMNSLLYVNQLNKFKIPHELHMYQSGPHGLGLATGDKFVKDWSKALEKWLLKNELISEKNLSTQSKRIFVIGDSTAASKLGNARPEAGWGEYLADFIDDKFIVENHAYNGRSTKSFIEQQRFTIIENNLKAGDYLLIQFGHNDGKLDDPERYAEPYGSYQENLSYYIEKTRAIGAIPIVLSSVPRRVFVNGRLDEKTIGEYPHAALQLAEKLNVQTVNAYEIVENYLNEIGEEESVRIFLHLRPGEHENYPDGVEDNTHFNEYGARKIAGLLAGELNKYLD
ncbi:GDSL-type esterase/lipase family protein [Fundicoccus sp. Sow4_H7]|uniref:GDSL-type esterase/lipase family protein n=1 Tax=Fundicoccus sp. Sow4_H7 TaxID=3438784 RepID=UPI003F8FE8C4